MSTLSSNCRNIFYFNLKFQYWILVFKFLIFSMFFKQIFLLLRKFLSIFRVSSFVLSPLILYYLSLLLPTFSTISPCSRLSPSISYFCFPLSPLLTSVLSPPLPTSFLYISLSSTLSRSSLSLSASLLFSMALSSSFISLSCRLP